jgi:hypothetical protein
MTRSSPRLGGIARMTETLSGTPVYLGVIEATTTKTNHTTTTAFNNAGRALKGKVILIQASAACHVVPVTVNNGAVTTANGIKMVTDETRVIAMSAAHGWLAVVGTASVKVFELV